MENIENIYKSITFQYEDEKYSLTKVRIKEFTNELKRRTHLRCDQRIALAYSRNSHIRNALIRNCRQTF